MGWKGWWLGEVVDGQEEAEGYRAAIDEAERRARADAAVFRRAAWVWGFFSGAILLFLGVLFLDARFGKGFDIYLLLWMVAGGIALVFLLPAGVTAMQVGKVVWRRWRNLRRGEG